MKRLLVVLVFFTAVSAFPADYTVRTGDILFVKTEVPQGKTGGGDFYSLNVTPDNGDYSSFSYFQKPEGVELVFSRKGIFRMSITVNHIVKSSCAGAEASAYSNTILNIKVTD